jgi:hypothetical protein
LTNDDFTSFPSAISLAIFAAEVNNSFLTLSRTFLASGVIFGTIHLKKRLN